MGLDIRSEIFNALSSTFSGLDTLQKRLRVVPGRADSPKIFVVQSLQPFGFAMAVETLADLQSEKFKGTSSGAGS